MPTHPLLNPPARIQSSSVSDEKVTQITQSNPNGAHQLEEEIQGIVDGYITNSQKQLAIDNERALKNPENISWLGSSFSGTDVKVVAHLYQPSRGMTEDRLSKLRYDKAVAKSIVDGCNRLLIGGMSSYFRTVAADALWDEKRAAFLSAAGLGVGQSIDAGDGKDPKQEAGRVLLGTVLASADFNTTQGISKSINSLTRLLHQYLSIETAIADDIKKLDQLETEGSGTVVLATLQTLSLQSHREKYGVRALGHSYVKGYSRGPRTIAGSMIFTVFEEHPLAILQRAMRNTVGTWKNPNEFATILPDQLPPIDLTVVFANEYGQVSELRMYGVEFVNDGITFSIEDLMSENVLQFVCRDADVLTSKGRVKLSRLQRGILDFEGSEKTGSSLLDDQYYKQYLDKIGVRRRLLNR